MEKKLGFEEIKINFGFTTKEISLPLNNITMQRFNTKQIFVMQV